MTYTLYADVLFLLNFVIDYICLWLTLYICRLRRKGVALTVSSFVGGIYALCAPLLWDMSVFIRVFVNVLSLIIICTIATPTNDARTIFKTSIVFLGVSSLLGGIITSIFNQFGKYAISNGMVYADISSIMLLGLFVIAIALSFPFFIASKNRLRIKTAKLYIEFENGKTAIDALIDSGNLLTDTLSGDGIILVKKEAIENHFTSKQIEAIKKLDVLSEDFPLGIRLIPSEKGLIPIIRPKKVTVKVFGKEKKEISAVIGLDFSEGSFGNTSGLLPAEYVE